MRRRGAFVPGEAEEIRRRGRGGPSAGRGAAAVGTEEVRRPPQSPLPGTGTPGSRPGACWGGKGAVPGGGARWGLGQSKGLGTPFTGKVFASSY